MTTEAQTIECKCGRRCVGTFLDEARTIYVPVCLDCAESALDQILEDAARHEEPERWDGLS